MDIRGVYDVLYATYGPQSWWPAETAFEVMAGAILTQNTAWSNVEKAIIALKAQALLTPAAILAAPLTQLATCVRSSGYFNVKAQRLRAYCEWFIAHGGLDVLSDWSTEELRHGLLGIKGVGPETADDILLYAFDRPVFVIDAYTRRIFTRLGLVTGEESYERLRAIFESSLGQDATLFNEFHALIVHHAKYVCRPKPLCQSCCMSEFCHYMLDSATG